MTTTTTRRRRSKPDDATAAEPDQPELEPELLNRRDAADRAGVHYNTIRLWESQRLLTPVKISVGRRQEVRIDAAELDRVAAEKAGARPAARAGALVIPAETLHAQLQDAGHQLAAALERAATAEVRAAMLEAQAAELRATLDLERQRNAQLVTALTERPATGRRWWQART